MEAPSGVTWLQYLICMMWIVVATKIYSNVFSRKISSYEKDVANYTHTSHGFSHPKKIRKSELLEKKQRHTFPNNGWPPGFQLPRLPWSTQGLATHRTAAPWIFRGRVRWVRRGRSFRCGRSFVGFGFKEKLGHAWGGQDPFILFVGMTSNMELNKIYVQGPLG